MHAQHDGKPGILPGSDSHAVTELVEPAFNGQRRCSFPENWLVQILDRPFFHT